MGCTIHTRMNRKDSSDRTIVIYLLYPLVAVYVFTILRIRNTRASNSRAVSLY